MADPCPGALVPCWARSMPIGVAAGRALLALVLATVLTLLLSLLPFRTVQVPPRNQEDVPSVFVAIAVIDGFAAFSSVIQGIKLYSVVLCWVPEAKQMPCFVDNRFSKQLVIDRLIEEGS